MSLSNDGPTWASHIQLGSHNFSLSNNGPNWAGHIHVYHDGPDWASHIYIFSFYPISNNNLLIYTKRVIEAQEDSNTKSHRRNQFL